MDQLNITPNGLQCEGVDLSRLAEVYGTPLFFYSWTAIADRFNQFTKAFAERSHQICFAVKSASNVALLHRLAKLGSGFDIVSGGELERVLKAGCTPDKIVFSGVGKTTAEMIRALSVGIGCFNIESIAELEELDLVARQVGTVAPIALRVNPNIQIDSHPYLCTGATCNKFGIPINQSLALYEQMHKWPGVKPIGLDCHIGSQMLSLAAFKEACEELALLTQQLLQKNIPIEHVDVGGGLGIAYEGQAVPSIEAFVQTAVQAFKNIDIRLVVEPGRSLIGPAGGLLTRVIRVKKTDAAHQFAIVDAAMTELLRPALYNAYHSIQAVESCSEPVTNWQIVGPVCESADTLGKDRQLALTTGSLLLIEDTGAYGFVMASEYNSRARPAEILIEQSDAFCIRARQTPADLFAQECIL